MQSRPEHSDNVHFLVPDVAGVAAGKRGKLHKGEESRKEKYHQQSDERQRIFQVDEQVVVCEVAQSRDLHGEFQYHGEQGSSDSCHDKLDEKLKYSNVDECLAKGSR